MAYLEGTDKSPFDKVRRLEEEKPRLTEKQKKAWQTRLDAYRRFRESPQGADALKIADMCMRECVRILSVPTRDIMVQTGLPLDAINEARAETRGRYLVWYEILNEPEMIVARLAQLEEQEKKAKEKVHLVKPSVEPFAPTT